MKSSKLLLTSLLAAAALSVPAYAEVTSIDTETYNSGANAVTVSGSVDTLNVAGAGNVTVAGDLAPKTEGGAVAVVLKNSGGLTFSLAEGETAETGRSYTVGTISTETDTGKNTRFLTVDAGVTVNATSLNNAWGMNALTVNGVLNVSGTFTFATGGGCANVVSGTGTISAGTFDFANVGSYTLTDVTLNVGTGGIVHKNANSHTLNLGNVSIVASVGDFTFANSNNETAKLTDASTTTFDTNGHVITVNQALSGMGKLKKVGEGTLKISGNNTYSGGTLIEAGTLELTSTGSLTGSVNVTSGSFTVAGTLNLSSAVTVAGTASVSVSNTAVFVLLDSLKISETGNTYSLISSRTINGWNAETLSVTNFRRSDGKYLSGRSTIDFSSAGSVTITGEAYNLFWKSGVTAWNSDTEFDKDSAGSGTISRFETCDNVTFATGNVTVTVAEDGVTAGTVTIASGTVEFRSGKVTAQDGFFVGDGVSEDDSTAKLVLSSNNALCGDVTVNKGGTFDLHAQSDSMSESGRIGKVVLNGGSLMSTGGRTENSGTSKRQIYNLELKADSKIIGDGTFGILGDNYDPTTLNLGANTLTKSGTGSFVLVNTTISGNGGVLDVTEGKILGLTEANKNIALGEGVILKTSGTGGAQDVKIASMGANSKLILGGSTPSTVALNGNFAVNSGVIIDVSGANAVTGTITSVGANAQLTLAGTGASAVTLDGVIGENAVVSVSSGTLSGTITTIRAGASLTLAGTTASSVEISSAVAAGANIEVSNGNSVTYTGTSLAGNVTVSGTGSTFTQGGTSKADQLAASGSSTGGTIQNTITVENGGTLDLADNRWSVKNGNAIVLDGGTITGTGQKTGEKYYGVLDFCGYNGDGEGAPINTVFVKNSFEKESFITGPVRLRDVGANFDIQGTAVLNITGRLAKSGALQKSGSGTLVLNLADDAVETNEAFSGAVTLSEGKIVLKYSSALGTGTVTASGSTGVNEVTLKVAEDSSGNALTIANNISVSSGKTLILQSENTGNKLAGVISGAGSLKATYSTFTGEALTLAGDNSFSGGLEVAGVKVSAEHANALGSGMIKISDVSVTYEILGPVTYSSSVNAATADVVLHDVSLLANNSAQLTADTDCNFKVAKGATLYLDIGALGDDVLTGEDVALTIAAASAFDNSFFSAVEVGTYGEDGSWVKDLQWAYVEGSWNVGAGTLSIAIPEPSAFGLLAGLGALALAGTRRRRKKA